VGDAYQALNRSGQALTHFQKALKISEDIGHKYEIVEALLRIGKIHQQQSQTDLTQTHLHRALALAEEIEAKREQYQCHEALAKIYKFRGDYEQALKHYERFHALEREVFNQAADNRLRTLEVVHKVETARKETEMCQLKNVALEQEIGERKRSEEQREKLIAELKEALSQVKTLSGLLPICASCKKIRDDRGYWHQVEVYLHHHSNADFTHGICPDCQKKLYPGLYANDQQPREYPPGYEDLPNAPDQEEIDQQ
jgi:tetratricopeptide (TPR) repeat protein